MFIYALHNYFNGGEIFFIFLQILIAVSTVLMMLNTNDVFDATIISFAGAGLVTYSFFLFQDYTTLIFVVGLVLLAIGYAFRMMSMWRQVLLAVGSMLIAIFSYHVHDQIFLWLNVFFAGFSFYYAYKIRMYSLVSPDAPDSQES